jgi:hypothetical protein
MQIDLETRFGLLASTGIPGVPPGASFRSQSLLQSAEADSRSAPDYTSSLCPFLAPSIPVCLSTICTGFAGQSTPKRRLLADKEKIADPVE